ncbi:CHAT domain-containing protein [Streptomyces rimosus]
MSQWAQALGALGALLMGVFGGANWRFPFLERYRILGLGCGLLTWVAAEFGVPEGDRPPWYEPLGAGAMLLAGAAGLYRGHQWSRRGRECGDDGPQHAAEGAANLRLYFKRDSTATLDAAVDAFRLAVRDTAGSGPHLRHHADLVKALRIRYERLRNRADLDDAVRVGGGARSLRGPKAHRALLLTELGTALRLRHEHTGASTDLVQARACGRYALALLHDRHLYFPLCSSRLSAVLLSSYEHSGDPRDLDAALTRMRSGIGSAAEHGYTRTADEIRLCYLLTVRGRTAGNPHDLAEAVAQGRRTLEHLAPADPLHPSCLHHLSVALRAAHDLPTAGTDEPRARPEAAHRTYRIRRADPPLEEAETFARQALLRVADDVPEGARYHLNHALVLHGLHRAEPSADRLERALRAARAAARHPTAEVPTRVRAGLVLSDIAAGQGLHAEAVEAFEDVIGLLPRLASHELERADQEQQIVRWPGIARAAATSALEAGEPARAAVLLEHGRGVLLARTLAQRTDLGALRAVHPRLAGELEDVRRQLTAPPPAPGAGSGHPTSHAQESPARAPELLRQARREQEERWEQLLQRIHEQPGFEDFARPPTAARLRAQSTRGPLIYLNVTDRRSDAIAVTPDGIRSVPLHTTPEEVEEQTRVLHGCFAPGAVADVGAQGPAYRVLGWMWDTLVAPALDAALPRQAAEGPLPQVWWVPTGPLAALPLHAAGHHREGGPALVDRAISSYTPTAHALMAARARPGPRTDQDSRLVVAVPAPPGARPLSSAAREAEFVRGRAPGATTLLADTAAVRERVLEELPRHAWAHFACHAVPDPKAPSRSRLLLHDHASTPLTVADVSALDLRGSRLAYLSACDTAVAGPRYRDEAIHLASAFQLAGFPHVISTLWQLPDRAAYVLAQEMYQALEEHLAAGEGVAAAVHAVTRRARREMFPRLPGVWAALVHVGP